MHAQVGSETKVVVISRHNAHNLRRSATRWLIAPLACSRGSTKSCTTGQTVTPGKMTKVWLAPVHASGTKSCTVLTWISIYWFSRAGPAASVRIYFEVMNGREDTPLSLPYPKIPMGASFFPEDIHVFPKAYVSAVLSRTILIDTL